MVGAVGARLSVELVIVLATINVIANGASAGFASFQQHHAEREHTLRERAREEWYAVLIYSSPLFLFLLSICLPVYLQPCT
jgi:hypothetical protein